MVDRCLLVDVCSWSFVVCCLLLLSACCLLICVFVVRCSLVDVCC